MIEWAWEQLLPSRADEFEWQYGRTPLSNVCVLYIAWSLYFGGMIYVRWMMAERHRVGRGHAFILVYNGCMLMLQMIVCCTGAWTLYHRYELALWDQQCHPLQLKGRFFYGIYICYLLRYVTLLDTLVLVLRKKPIPFLHWYQHMFAPLILWSWLDDQSVFGGAAISIMSLVQVSRYSYYFVTSLSSNGFAKEALMTTVTMLETVQMIAGLLLTVYQRVYCPQSNGVLLSACINISMASIAVTYDQKGPSPPVTRQQRKVIMV
ncbi:GNS1/SUR4 family-domain-containing protein [Gongronella butleri]|nr:GNS1/SUR4 family-domain-containing protein [Gongronella butleri]